MQPAFNKVLNAGEVNLHSFMGDDLNIVNAAKVSFHSYESEMNDKAKGLLNFLIKNHHATPFEHVIFKFHIKCPIFVAREWMRHRWSSFNEMSMRYHVPENLEFYMPDKSAIRQQVGKPGSYSFEEIEDNKIKLYTLGRLDTIYKMTESVYRDLLNLGVAKEIARSVLPVGQYTEFIWTVNLRSLMNFLALRNSEHAQHEIAEYAKVIENIFQDCLPETYLAWTANGREAI